MLLAAVLLAGKAELATAEVMRCSTGRHLCGATRPAEQGQSRAESVTRTCASKCGLQEADPSFESLDGRYSADGSSDLALLAKLMTKSKHDIVCRSVQSRVEDKTCDIVSNGYRKTLQEAME